MQKDKIAAGGAISALNKGLGLFSGALTPEEISARRWNLLHEDLGLPTAVLYKDKVLHNLNFMQEFVGAYGVRLAPHGKTTMAPKLFGLQLQHGAWGITLATAHQVRVAYEHGVRRVLMANQLVGQANMALVSNLIEDPEFEYYCLADSADLVDQLGAFFLKRGQRLRILLELGVIGGRTGVRNDEQLRMVLEALGRWTDSVMLCGVEMYEGILDNEAAIHEFLKRAIGVTRMLAAEKRFQRNPILLSGAGSVWYDVVADAFAAAGFGDAVEIVLRPGCYVTHDVGPYREAQAKILERNPVAKRMRSGLVPALHLWAYVQSRPERELAILTMGKRDAAFDSGLPAPALHFRPGNAAPEMVPASWQLSKMNDQHAYLEVSAGDDLCVGDMLAFDISHPCLTFDKWRTLPVLDAQYQVVDVVQTFF